MRNKPWLGVRLPRIVLTVGAVLIPFFAVMPWIHIARSCLDCEPIDISGSEVKLVTGFGDGRLVALLGISMVLLRISLIWLGRWETAVLSLIAALALAAMGIAGAVAVHDWAGERTVWLYGDIVLGVVVALCAAGLLSGHTRDNLLSADGKDTEQAAEVTETWA